MWCSVEPGVGLSYPCMSLPIQDILCFFHSVTSSHCPLAVTDKMQTVSLLFHGTSFAWMNEYFPSWLDLAKKQKSQLYLTERFCSLCLMALMMNSSHTLSLETM